MGFARGGGSRHINRMRESKPAGKLAARARTTSVTGITISEKIRFFFGLVFVAATGSGALGE